ncbi:MAG: T9SS type A sorting domain-containing protein [Calditrichaeota bacterium]|nr:T9SS type A sorting domain-containing protein [Calditrichota bacterium]
MNQVRALIFCIAISTVIASAQPPPEWARNYGDQFNDFLRDVYLTADGGYAMCGRKQINENNAGSAWIVVTDIAGNVIFSNDYGDLEEREQLWTIIEVEGGGFIAGGHGDRPWSVWVLRVNALGDEIWRRNFGERENGRCHAVIELKAGTFMIAGQDNGQGYLANINDQGGVIWERWYGDRDAVTFYSMRETDNGILVAGTGGEDAYLVMASPEDGEVVWDSFYQSQHMEGEQYNSFRSIISCEGGFVMVGTDQMRMENNNSANWYWFVRIDQNGNTIWNQSFELGELVGRGSKWVWGLTGLPDGGFAGVGWDWSNNGAIIIRIDSAGNLMWSRNYPRDDQNQNGFHAGFFWNAVTTPDGGILAVGGGSVGNERGNGILVKLVPDYSAPHILSIIPDTFEFKTLLGDTILFAVEATDLQNDELSYIWTFGEDTVSTDTSTVVHFEELGDQIIECSVSDIDQTVSVQWLIHVKEFYIDQFSPGSTDLEIRRNSSIDFEHHVRAIEGIEFDYRWEHFGRGGNYEFEGEDSVRFDFDLTGDHVIRAFVVRNNLRDRVEWDVNVQSILWWWWPHELNVSAHIDTTMIFEVFPFSEESDSLGYSWLINNEVIDSDSSSIEIPFPEIGEFEIAAFVREGIEADTIRWTVNILERSFTAEFADLAKLPSSPVLFPPSPNPFNSTVRLSIYLPREDLVLLSVFDINGREVSRLVNGKVGIGNQTFVWYASGFPAGVYIVRMYAGDVSKMMKVVLVR